MAEKTVPPLAIVGLSLKFPQDAVSPESFWEMVVEGRCASTDFPPDRLSIDSHHNLDSSRLDSLSPRGAHFLAEDLSLFDAPFFSITAAEADAMDPQQRLVLETAFRALENGGITMNDIAQSKTCVFAAVTGHDYLMLSTKDTQYLHKWNITGTTSNMLANRVSWFFDLNGPSAAIDTACSSSLMAIDMTCQSIWSGDSTMGLAIGSNIILALETSLMMDNLGLLSKDSHCYSFDQRANGYSRGEGVGVLVIKPLEDAVRDGDTIRAVIRSSASNQDGKTPGITQPSPKLQEQLIRDTYHKVGLDIADTRYFEAHGTGTAVGDPTEINAIGSVFRPHRSVNEPLYIGSVKSNIGHLEGASGIAGVIKTVLALEKGIIPPNSVNLQNLNTRIDDSFLNINFPQRALPWPSEGLRRASVSSFGYGGSNSHIILDDAYHFLKRNGLKGIHNTLVSSQSPESRSSNWSVVGEISSDEDSFSPDDAPKLFVLSAADEKGIIRLQKAWKSRCLTISNSSNGDPSFLKNLAYTLTCRRTHFSWRTWAIARPSESLETLLSRFLPTPQSRVSANLAMIFSGQGAQWYAMGRELLDLYPVFLRSVEEAGQYLQTLGCEWNPIDEFSRGESSSNVNKTEYSQILCTILQVALVDLLRSLNIIPKAVLGHSSGEVAAAYCSRGISRNSAWKVSYYRGNMSSTLEKTSKMKGSMLAVALSEKEVLSYLERLAEEFEIVKVSVGCINSLKSVTMSGEVIQLESMKIMLEKDDVFCRMLKVNLAYHSSQMKEIADLYMQALGELESDYTGNKHWPEMISSVTGDWVKPGDTACAAHWVNNMVSPVQFSDALSTLCSGSSADLSKKLDGSHRRKVSIDHILEAGPHSVLQGPCKDVLKNIKRDTSVEYISLLVRNKSAEDTVLAAFGKLHTAGYPIDLAVVNGFTTEGCGILKSLPDLPEYPFNHDISYWHESDISKNYRLRQFACNDLLGVADPTLNPFENRWRHFLRVSEMPWTQDHQINGTILYPAAGMLAMAIEAAKQVAEQGRTIAGFNIEEAKFLAAIIVPPGTLGIETSFYLRPTKNRQSKGSSWYDFRLCTYENKRWTENCTGSIQTVYTSDEDNAEMDKRQAEELQSYQLASCTDSEQACTLLVDRSNLYTHLQKSGYSYGDAFQLIKTLSLSPEKACVVAQVERFVSSAGEIIHPTTLDAIMQTSIFTTIISETEEIPTAVPTSVGNLWVASRALSNLSCNILRTHATHNAGSTFLGPSVDIIAFDTKTNAVLISFEKLGTNVVGEVEPKDSSPESANDLCHHVQWKPNLNVLSNKEAADLCRGELSDLPDPSDFFNDVDFICMARISEALEMLNDQVFKPSNPHLEHYVEWMKYRQKLLDQGQIRFSSETWKIRLTDNSFLHNVEHQLLNLNKRGYLYVTIAQNLQNLLTGQLDPLSLLQEGNMLKEFFFEELNESHGIKQFGKYLDLQSHINPKMKIVEVGAGDGSMTEIMLQTLGCIDKTDSQYAQWDFTDISTSLFSDAQTKFQQETRLMKFKVLNIEEDPQKQGFDCGTYDMVVACLVFHATSDLKATLCHARKLLKPGGKLILYEIVVPNVRSTFVFGLLEEFWRSSESYRTLGPCIDTRQWNELLLQTGFSGLDVILPDFDGSISHEYALMVSTAVDEPTKVAPVSKIEIVYNSVEPMQQELALSLVKYCGTISTSAICSSVEEAISHRSDDSLLKIFLLELEGPIFSDIQPELFSQLQLLLSSTTRVLWINQGGGILASQPHAHLTEGLFRVLMTENSNRDLHLLSLEPTNVLNGRQNDHIARIVKLLLSTAAPDAEMEYMERDGLLHSPRLISSQTLNDSISLMSSSYQRQMQEFDYQTPLQLNADSPGLLNGFEFVENAILHSPLQPDEIEIEVKCAGVNFRDILIAVGQLKANHTGSECSGIVTKVGNACEEFRVGDSVAALVDGSFANLIRIRESGPVVKIPDGISYSDASAVPVTFATAYVSLHNVAHIQPGETVLIHSGTGGTGQAAIQIAQKAGATVFATVGSKSKKQLLMDAYNIPESHIFSSRSTLFSKMIKLRTGGKGVDVILNSLAGESLLASWRCIAPYGRFLEIGKKDILSNQQLPMLQFLDNVSYSGVDLAVMSHERPEVCIAALKSVFASIKDGTLHPPQPINLFGVGEIEKAFRLIQSGKHIGKIIIEMKRQDRVMTVLKTRPSLSLDPNATFVVSGGLGGLGKNISCWLADHGARHLLVLSRSGSQGAKGMALTRYLEKRGVQILAPSCDISDEESLQNALSECRSKMPPIKGCIQAAMVLRDALFEGISHELWREVLGSKVQGSWNLHRQLPKGMDFFIMLSSIAGVLGNAGQANYAAGNTFQDALARHRIGLNEKATALDLGAIAFAGAIANDSRLHEELISNVGFKPVTEAQIHALLSKYCDPEIGLCTSLECQTTVGLTPSALSQSVQWQNRPLVRRLIRNEQYNADEDTESGGTIGASSLKHATSLSNANELVTAAFAAKLSKALGIAVADIDANKPLHQYGVDSLVAVELRSWFGKELQAELGVFEILGEATLSSVAKLATRKSKLVTIA
ncbi:hypothetical protein N7495_006295 [Penicillium taxi]|uniref:uncharacterized protein n=1 Tax=Penicillium taxi TaxID=168475 RepID=UPI0025456BFD|nr:uncharacterized protein N7495_006295 [Penicillium taxi]KAJ5894604.1 hypothetical protein N7495_006295 [Penicillium taxi]